VAPFPGFLRELGDVGVLPAGGEIGGSKAAWIKDALGRIPTEYPSIRALLWFDKFDDGMDWPIETSPKATAAFAKGIAKGVYQPNRYAELNVSPIPPQP